MVPMSLPFLPTNKAICSSSKFMCSIFSVVVQSGSQFVSFRNDFIIIPILKSCVQLCPLHGYR